MLRSTVLLLLVSAYSICCNKASTIYQKGNDASIAFLNIAVDLFPKAQYNESLYNEPIKEQKPIDCVDLFQLGHKASGVYKVWTMNGNTDGQYVSVYCDMVLNGSEWIVIQKEDFQRDSNNFVREWKIYNEGFDNLTHISIGNDRLKKQKPVDCADLFQMGYNVSGVYKIWPMNRKTNGQYLSVYCDMETDGGGWTVLQRRGDFQRLDNYFYKDWISYKEGFGNIEEDFWIGNDNIYALTNQKLYSVRFDLEDFDQNKRYAHYDKFWIDDEYLKYTIHISDYSGNNTVNAMDYHNNQKFSTKDQDNDDAPLHCAEHFKGAWWYRKCHSFKWHLNGIYYTRQRECPRNGVYWSTRDGVVECLKRTEVKIRPKDFKYSYISENNIDIN